MNVYIFSVFFYQFQQSCRIIIATAPDQNGNTKPIIIITFASFFRLNLTELFAWRRKYNIISMVHSFVSHSIIFKNRISKCAEKEENNKAYQKTMVYRKQYSLQRSMTLYDYIVWFTTIIIAQIIPTILANYQQSFSYRRSIQPSYTHRVNICKSIYWSDTCHRNWWMFSDWTIRLWAPRNIFLLWIVPIQCLYRWGSYFINDAFHQTNVIIKCMENN